MKKLIILFLFTIIAFLSIKGQVTIGLGEAPISGAALQIKTIEDEVSKGGINSTIGIGFPRVQLVKKNLLQPMYTATEASGLSLDQKQTHRGLVVYNLEEVDDTGTIIPSGLNFWDGEQWIAISETQNKAEIFIDCSKIRSYGRYFRRAPLTNDNYIVMPVHVTKKGDYSIVASSGNGYYFQANGVFTSAGDYEIKLEAMGTPAASGTDNVTFTNNKVSITNSLGQECSISINVGIEALTYRILDCDKIQVKGSYQTRLEMTGNENYVEIPVEILTVGTTSWETNFLNGVKFVANQTFTAQGETTLTLKAQGVPKQSGKFTYTFTTDGTIKNHCSFAVDFFSTLGTYNDPACKCLDIYEERPDVSNGEYFLQDCQDLSATPVKTFCDIVNGGYTLVWSFSELTARNIYNGGTTMEMNASYRFGNDMPRNRVTTENGVINYADYRLTRTEFQHFPNSIANPILKVRICENATDMNDEWGLNNYGVLSPRTTGENPIETLNFGPLRVPTVGKLWGKRWEIKAVGGGAYGGWDEVSGNRHIAAYSNTLYPTHWDFGLVGSSTLFSVIPDRGGLNNLQRMNVTNNMFGWFGETQPNHHFGKCGGATADEFSFMTKGCSGTSLFPHSSINNGEGRYLQWFVK